MATKGRLRQALQNGYLQPLPKKAGGAHQFTSGHLRQLREYLVRVRPGPRPQWGEKIRITGAADRVHRLARKKQRLRDRGPSEKVLRGRRQKAADAAILYLEDISQRLALRALEAPTRGGGAQ